MSTHKAYEKAVNINDRDPTYWCSIGVLYYYNNQYHDALDTYSRALQLNPELSEIWYNLGILYECCNQITDAVDAYTTAAALDPSNQKIKNRLTMLKRQKQQPAQGAQQQQQANQQVQQQQTGAQAGFHMSAQVAQFAGNQMQMMQGPRPGQPPPQMTVPSFVPGQGQPRPQ
eukprot:SAG31_NODE_7206_length_1755_cov_1.945048_1_plen_171_part_10